MCIRDRVSTVIPYYEKFLRHFPNITKLAHASEQSVLEHWQGLGYYSRARNLHAAAKEVCAQYNGKLPSQSSQLINLKGFGPYTSASVASIAFNEAIVCIDGNVRRVTSRLFASNENVDELAQSLTHKRNSRDFNQALMDIGANICTPKNPCCLICP